MIVSVGHIDSKPQLNSTIDDFLNIGQLWLKAWFSRDLPMPMCTSEKWCGCLAVMASRGMQWQLDKHVLSCSNAKFDVLLLMNCRNCVCTEQCIQNIYRIVCVCINASIVESLHVLLILAYSTEHYAISACHWSCNASDNTKFSIQALIHVCYCLWTAVIACVHWTVYSTELCAYA